MDGSFDMTRAVLIKGRKVGPNTVELDEPLPEEATDIEVVARVRETSARPPLDPDDPTGWKAIRRLIGAGQAVDPDVSENHDDHLYGDPAD
jgi:hypothetical protein